MLLNDIARQSVIDAAEELYEARKYLECGGSRRERIERAELEFERSVRENRQIAFSETPLPFRRKQYSGLIEDANGVPIIQIVTHTDSPWMLDVFAAAVVRGITKEIEDADTEGRRTAAVDTSGSAASLGDPRLDSRRPWD